MNSRFPLGRLFLLLLFLAISQPNRSVAQVGHAVALLKGDISSTDGQKLPDIKIAVYSGTERVNNTKSNADGKFTMTLHPNANYRITFSDPNYGYHEEMLNIPALDEYREYQLHPVLSPLRDNETVNFSNPIFSQNGSTIDPSAMSELDNIANLVQKNPRLSLSVQVFPDGAIRTKKDAAQQRLVDSRASAVRSYFMGKIPAQSYTISESSVPPEGAPVLAKPAKKRKKIVVKQTVVTKQVQYITITTHVM